ncbi:MAG: DUF72 domain-containing protein, partial [Streptosporangiaceae bacterium]|nr:DUF72 domain-containing protein [Streptosporangiaceae bacterium]
FGYWYGQDELREWAAKVRDLADEAETTNVLFNNCCGDYSQVNARQLTELLANDAGILYWTVKPPYVR